MGDVTQILTEIRGGDPAASERLLPLVYDELRRLAAQRLAREAPGQTLQPTALVHEAYVRLVTAHSRGVWQSRGHFFAAAAQAMRRILVDKARAKRTLKRGGGKRRLAVEDCPATPERDAVDVLELDRALALLAEKHPRKAALVELRFFSGLSMEQAAEALGVSAATAYREWAYARAWLHREIFGDAG